VSIAEICLVYLLQFDHPNSLTFQTFKEFPLARYAVKYWIRHARFANSDMNTIHQLIVEFFLRKKDAYLNWIRLFGADGWRKEPDISKSLEKNLVSVPSPLYYVTLFGLVESLRLLLRNGADVNAQEDSSVTRCNRLQLKATIGSCSDYSRAGRTLTCKEDVTVTRCKRLQLQATIRS
jgi:hypothetical protein